MGAGSVKPAAHLAGQDEPGDRAPGLRGAGAHRLGTATDRGRTFLALAPERHRLLFRFLAATGLRISELFAVQRRHLTLDGSSPNVAVRRACVRGRLEPPKTRNGRRKVPLPHALVLDLRAWHAETEWPRDEDLVFPALNGEPLNYGNLRSRALVPIAEEAGVPWVTFHTFRHTVASLLFELGRNPKQVQRWLGHHSAAFTLERYIHLLSDELDEPLEIPQHTRLGKPAEVSEPVPAINTGDGVTRALEFP